MKSKIEINAKVNGSLGNTIVAFHVGRGGQFYNPGHLTFIGFHEIGEFTERLFLTYENLQNFKNRFGFEYTGDTDQKCILDLVANKDFDELEEAFGITEEMLGEEIYTDGGGNFVGLTQKDVESGIGCIKIDGQYDTTSTCYLKDCSDSEINAIRNSNEYNKEKLLSYFDNE